MRPRCAKAGVLLGLLATLGCIRASGGGSAGDLELLGTNVTPGQVWFVNAPIEFRFDREVDVATANFSTIPILAAPPVAAGAPAAGPAQGSFFLKIGSEDRTLVFQPLCPTDPNFLNGGFVPGNPFGGAAYSVTVLGKDATTGPVVQGKDGSRLGKSLSFSIETPTGYPLLDPNPSGPPKVVETESLPSILGPNLLIDPIPPLTIVLDQALKASSLNDSSLRLEFTHPATGKDVRIPATVLLAANCTASGHSTLNILPIGILPLGQTVRFVLAKEVEGLGEADQNPADVPFHLAPVVGPLGIPQRDAILEEFDSSDQMDPAPQTILPLAEWGGGLLQASPVYPGEASNVEIEIGPGTLNGANVIFPTDGGTLKDNTGTAILFSDGVIDVGSFKLKAPPAGQTTTFQGTGPNPLVIRCSKSFTIEKGAVLTVDGQNAPAVIGLNTPNLPAPPGEGRCGGGSGGAGSPATTESDTKGEDGNGAFNSLGVGGKGGHSGYGSASPTSNRPGGGGGGNWGSPELDPAGNYVTICYSKPDTTTGLLCMIPGCPQPLVGCTFSQSPICAGLAVPPNTLGEDGTSGVASAKDAISGIAPALAGKAGDSIFVDGIDNNNFRGRKPVGSVVLAGELNSLLGGQGGGGGGDNVASSTFPPSSFLQSDSRGAGGGGGAGILVIQSLGPITVLGTINANGGDGGTGEEFIVNSIAGGGGGGGAGGMVILESPTSVKLGFSSAVNTHGGNRGQGGGTVPGGAPYCSGGNECKSNCSAARGGAGAKLEANILVPFDGASLVSCGDQIQPRIRPGALLVETSSAGAVQNILCERDPLLAQHFSAVPHVLIPTFGPQSAALSRWLYTGWADVVGTLHFEFGGIGASGLLDSTFSKVLAAGSGGNLLSPTAAVLTSPALAALVSSAPRILIEDGFRPTAAAGVLPIVNASVSGSQVTIATDPSGGSIPALGEWQILRRSFATSVNGLPGSFPASANAKVLLEGADELSPGSMLPDLSSLIGPTTDVASLQGKKLLRYRVEFDMNATGQPLSTSLPRPGTFFLKFPLFFP